MKKTFKKLTAILLVTMLLAVSLPLQSFAIFDGLRIPIIKGIEFSEKSQVISMKKSITGKRTNMSKNTGSIKQ